MPEQLILHAGAHKTASSLVQKALQLNDAALRRSGLLVVHRTKMVSSDFCTILKELVVTGETPDDAKSDRARHSLEALSDGDLPAVLFTNEDLLEAFRRPKFYRHIGPALSWIRTLTDAEVSLLLYTRAQPSYVESMYMQRIHLGDAVPFSKFFRTYSKLELSWTHALRDAAAVLGPDNVTAVPFESIKRLGPAAYTREFLVMAGVDPSVDLDVPVELAASRDANRSYSADAMKLALAINPLLQGDDRPKLRRFLQENYSTATHSHAVLLTDDERVAVTERYRQDNADLFDSFMPEWKADAEAYGVSTTERPTELVADCSIDVVAPRLHSGSSRGAAVGGRAATSPVVDVLIPHYEDVPALAMSLDSIAHQTWAGALRVIIVDDGSDPLTFAEVERVAASQPFPVRLRRFDENRGRPYARNALLDEVDAPYLAWLDAGDLWYPDKLSMQFEHLHRLEMTGADLDRIWVTCHIDWVENGRTRRVLQRTTSDQLSDLLLGDRLRAYLWTLLGRTAAFRAAGKFDEALPRLQDLDYFLRFVTAGGTLAAPPSRTPLCRYIKSDVGRNHQDVADGAALIKEKYRPEYARYGRGFVAQSEWKNARLAARFAINNRSYGSATKHLSRAVLANPRYVAYRVRTKLVHR